ncbi:hypothetical protein E4T42_08957 [Aureobasidium subglaciale]|nr:hypothetical protein E4T42_08957 [Aureobasidium subglaciale]
MSITTPYASVQAVIDEEQCAWWVIHGAKPVADSDVSGVGTVVAFLLSAYITIGLAIAAYFLGAIDAHLLGPVDLLVHRIPSRPRISKAWQKALDACVLLFSDQQIMTGLAMLVAGFVGLVGRMDVYHFQVVIMLAWMSSSVNLTALTVLGQYFEEHRAVFFWRLAGMMILLILLLIALVPTTSNHWAIWKTEKGDVTKTTGWAVPARCYFHHEMSGGVNADAPLSYILLISSYIWKLGSMSKIAKSSFCQYVRGPPEKVLQSAIERERAKCLESRTQRRTMVHFFFMVLYVDFLVFFEFAASFAASLWVSVLGLAYGTIQSIIPRRQNSIYSKDEDQWTFGQLVPLILMVQPIGAMLELYRNRESLESRSPTSDIELQTIDTTVVTAIDISPITALHINSTSKPIPGVAVTAQFENDDHLPETSDLKTLIMVSGLFRLLIVLTHLSLIAFSIVIFDINAKTIGYSATYDYLWLLQSVAFYIGVILVVTIMAMPLSKVFKLNT